MSSEDRLKRLGLSHLADKPDELLEALRQGYAKDQADALMRRNELPQKKPAPKPQ